MKILLVLLLVFSFFLTGNNVSKESQTFEDEEIKKTLLSENVTEDEVVDFLISQLDTWAASKAKFFLQYYYLSEKNLTNAGHIIFENSHSYVDAMGYTNYEFDFNASSTITFQKDSIYFIKPFVDDDSYRGDLELSVDYFFKAAYGVNIFEKEISTYTFNCDEFCDGDYSYEDYSEHDQAILQYINDYICDMVEGSYDGDLLMVVPHEDFTCTLLANAQNNNFGSHVFPKFSTADNNYERHCLYDFGFIVTETKRVLSDEFIDLEAPTFIVDVDNPISFETIKSQITAYDKTEGDITSKIVISNNNYVLSNGKIGVGTYSFTATVSDLFDNTCSKVFNIMVVDITKPTLIASDMTITYNETLSDSDLVNNVNYSDNVSAKDKINYNITLNEYNSAPSYKTFKAKCGTYNISISFTDEANNTNSVSFSVNVIDNIAPAVVVPEEIISTTTNFLTMNDIKEYISVVDEYDNNATYSLYDAQGYNTTKKVGTYKMRIEAKDSSNNTSTVYFNVKLVDTDVPTIGFKDDYLIVINVDEILTKDKLILLLSNNIDLSSLDEIEIESDYFASSIKGAGKYEITITGIDRNTKEKVSIKTELDVIDSINTVPVAKEEENKIYTIWNENKILIIVASSLLLIAVITLIFYLKKKGKKNG